MVDIVPGSLTFTMPREMPSGLKAKPRLFMNDTNVVCHLSEGFTAAGVPKTSFGGPGGNSLLSAVTGFAWMANADFDLDTDDAAQIAKFDFGFVQMANEGQFSVEYAGAKAPLGSIALSPSISNTTFLDTEATIAPWTRPPTQRLSRAGKGVSCLTGDHPAIMFRRTAENFHPSFSGSGAVQNHFRLIRHDMDFLTVLVKSEKATLKMDPLASFRWSVKYRFDVKYKGGKPITSIMAAFDMDQAAKIGQPSFSPDEKHIFDTRGGLLFNGLAGLKLRDAQQKGSPDRRDDPTWFLSVPKDFMT